MSAANPVRGEASLTVGGRRIILRPTFQALVAAEVELGSLFTLVERAAAGQLTLQEITTLFHCLAPEDVARDTLGEALVEQGLATVMPVLRVVLGQVLQGR